VASEFILSIPQVTVNGSHHSYLHTPPKLTVNHPLAAPTMYIVGLF